jgi:hypothetical protein
MGIHPWPTPTHDQIDLYVYTHRVYNNLRKLTWATTQKSRSKLEFNLNFSFKLIYDICIMAFWCNHHLHQKNIELFPLTIPWGFFPVVGPVTWFEVLFRLLSQIFNSLSILCSMLSVVVAFPQIPFGTLPHSLFAGLSVVNDCDTFNLWNGFLATRSWSSSKFLILFLVPTFSFVCWYMRPLWYWCVVIPLGKLWLLRSLSE